MKRLLALVLLLLVLLPALPAQAAAQPRVVVVGVAGLRWDDVGASTPTLSALADRGAVGALSVKAVPLVSCPADGWLTLGAGARAQSFAAERDPCREDLPPVTEQERRRNADTADKAELGALAAALGGLQGEGPGAQLAGAGGTDARVRVLDLGSVDDSDRPAAVAAVDEQLGAVVSALPPAADLLVVGLSESPGDDRAHLHLALAAGPSFPQGQLRSASSRRDGYVQLVDVAPTVLDLVGLTVPEAMDGQPWRRVAGSLSPAQLADRDTRAVEGKSATVPFFVILVVVVVFGAAALRRRPRAVRGLAVLGIAGVGASYAVMLVPWWRAGPALLALLGLVAVLAGAVTALCLRTRNPVGWVCGAVSLLLIGDLITGAHLQLESPAGYSSLVAGRFAGIGNVAFGVYGSCVLLATAALADGRARRPTLLVVGACGLVAVAADGAPPWGSDVGGVLALLPAFLVLGMLLGGIRVSLVRLLLAGLAGAVVVTAFALVDHSRPPADRTHLGRFVDQVQDGTAGEVLHRKAAAIGDLLFGNPVTALLPLVVVAVVYLFLRPPAPLAATFDAEPTYRSALLAVGLMAALGFALNDSGPAVVALAVVVVGPATLAVMSGVAAGRAPVASP